MALYPPSPPASTPAETPDATATHCSGGGQLPTATRTDGGTTPGDRSPPAPFDLRLIDLGNSVFAADAVPGVTAGTPSYLSPEARKGLPWGPKVDVWAVGCILYEIVTGARVRSGSGGGDGGGFPLGVGGALGERGGGGGGFPFGVGGALGERGGVMGLVRRLLAEEVDARPTAGEALKDAVFL